MLRNVSEALIRKCCATCPLDQNKIRTLSSHGGGRIAFVVFVSFCFACLPKVGQHYYCQMLLKMLRNISTGQTKQRHKQTLSGGRIDLCVVLLFRLPNVGQNVAQQMGNVAQHFPLDQKQDTNTSVCFRSQGEGWICVS